MRQLGRRRLLQLLAVTVFVAGCGDARQSLDERVEEGTAGAGTSAVGAQADPRKVVYTADLTVRVDDAVRATEQATQIAKDAEGLLFAQSSDLEGRKETRLTLKVPPNRFESALAALSGLGRALTRDAKAPDVTDQVVDIEGRLMTAKASADRLRALLGDAGSTAEIVAVEAELAKRESEVESLEGRLRVLNTQVDLATINVTLTERATLEVNREVPGFLSALRADWAALLSVLLAVVAVGAFLVPFAPVGLVAWWMARRYRSRRPRLPHPPRPPFAPPSPAPPSPVGGPSQGSESALAESTGAPVG